MEKQWKQWETLLFRAPKSLQMVTASMKLKDASSLEEKLWKPRQHIKKQRHYFANKGPYIQSYVFFHSHVWMWDLDNKDSWALKNDFELWSWRRLESPLDCKENKPVNPKGNQYSLIIEYSLEGLMLKLQYFGYLMRRANSLEKILMLGKIEGRRGRGWQRIR